MMMMMMMMMTMMMMIEPMMMVSYSQSGVIQNQRITCSVLFSQRRFELGFSLQHQLLGHGNVHVLRASLLDRVEQAQGILWNDRSETRADEASSWRRATAVPCVPPFEVHVWNRGGQLLFGAVGAFDDQR